MLTLLHHAIQHRCFMMERLRERVVEAELQCDGWDTGELRIARLPNLTKAASPQQFYKFPIANPRRSVSGFESGHSRRKEGQQVFWLPKGKALGDGSAAGIVRTGEGFADRCRDLDHESRQGL